MSFLSLPGNVVVLKAGHGLTCDWDETWGSEEAPECACSNPATHRLQGETDSFGAEYHYLCDEHIEKNREREETADRSGCCDWCKKDKPELNPRRDIDEGSNGPVYNVCRECAQKDNEQLQAELDSYDNDGDWCN